ncbi:hypothetical protein RI367_003658 [Sorochytrium milnesiophthora]
MDFDFNNPPHFDAASYRTLASEYFFIILVAFVSSALGGMLLLDYKRRGGSASSLLLVNQLASNSSAYVAFVFLWLPKLITHSYSLGYVGCQVEGFITMTTAYAMMCAALWLALDRFLIIVLSRPSNMHPRVWTGVICAGWLFSCVMAALPFMTGGAYVMQPEDMNHCARDYGAETPTARAQLFLIAGIQIACNVTVVTVYLIIYLKVRFSQQELSNATQTPQTASPTIAATRSVETGGTAVDAPATPQSTQKRKQSQASKLAAAIRPGNGRKATQLERTVLIKATIICIASVIASIPNLCRIYYTQQHATEALLSRLNLLTSSLVGLRCVMDVGVVSIMDPVARKLLREQRDRIKAAFSRS